MRALELNSNKSHNGTCPIMTLDSNMSYNICIKKGYVSAGAPSNTE